MIGSIPNFLLGKTQTGESLLGFEVRPQKTLLLLLIYDVADKIVERKRRFKNNSPNVLGAGQQLNLFTWRES
jgi:hypothetical protein